MRDGALFKTWFAIYSLKCSRDGINEQSVSTYSFISNVSARNIYQNKFIGISDLPRLLK